MKNKLKQIIDFEEGQKIKGFFLCTGKHSRFTKKNDKYIDLELRDITGHISAKIWRNTKSLTSKFESGDAVAISGNVESYKGNLQLIVIKVNKATVQYYGRYGFDPGLIVPKSKKDPARMYTNIENMISKIDNKYFYNLAKNIIKKYNGTPIISPTGHFHIKNRIKEHNPLLAGEMSGHIFFNDKWYGFDDGHYSGARIIELISKNNCSI